MGIDVSKLKVPNISGTSIKVMEVISGDDPDLNMVGDLIAKDPLLSSTLLRIANSAMYRREKEIDNVRTAVGMLGAKKVRMAVTVVSMRSIAAARSPIQELEWEHCFAISALCRLIGHYAFPVMMEDLELTGLLHDMGALILIGNYPKEYEKLVAAANSRTMAIVDAEKKFFGVDRNEVLMTMSEGLHLPAITRQAMEAFRAVQPVTSIDSAVDTHLAVLSLAHYIDMSFQGENSLPVEKLTGDMASLKALVGLSDENIDDIMEEYQDILNDLLTV
ncbi:MAG: HDOD domain-containing protein [Gammaproteobacteria bacterium]|nr:HDOD domain-containing protein [Gammaproteobacteria bacterium]